MQLVGQGQPQFRSLEELLLDMGRERSVGRLLELIVGRLARRKDVAVARLWLVGRGDICPRCPLQPRCPDQSACLHLAASAGEPTTDPGAGWSLLDGGFRRFPLGLAKIGRVASEGESVTVEEISDDAEGIIRPDWAQREGIRSFGGQPLICDGEVLGVLAVFTRVRLVGVGQDWLRLIADHAAAAIVNARAFEAVEHLKGKLELENASLRMEVEEARASGGGNRVLPDAEMKRRDRANVRAALETTGWKIYGPGGAAELLGVKPTTLASRIRKMGLDRSAPPPSAGVRPHGTPKRSHAQKPVAPQPS